MNGHVELIDLFLEKGKYTSDKHLEQYLTKDTMEAEYTLSRLQERSGADISSILI